MTAVLAPGATENEAPELTLNGAATLALPVRVTLPVFCTVKVRSTAVPVVTLPKLVVLVGVTLNSG
jgi:hypothetical protein